MKAGGQQLGQRLVTRVLRAAARTQASHLCPRGSNQDTGGSPTCAGQQLGVWEEETLTRGRGQPGRVLGVQGGGHSPHRPRAPHAHMLYKCAHSRTPFEWRCKMHVFTRMQHCVRKMQTKLSQAGRGPRVRAGRPGSLGRLIRGPCSVACEWRPECDTCGGHLAGAGPGRAFEGSGGGGPSAGLPGQLWLLNDGEAGCAAEPRKGMPGVQWEMRVRGFRTDTGKGWVLEGRATDGLDVGVGKGRQLSRSGKPNCSR